MSLLTHPGGITTLHRLNGERAAALEAELAVPVRERPVTLILPCRARDVESGSLEEMVHELAGAEWISRIIVGVDSTRQADVEMARLAFAPLRRPVQFLWTESPAVLVLEQELDNRGLTVADTGRGRHLWLCLGAALAGEDASPAGILAFHNCDLHPYSREIPARLCWPLLQSGGGFQFVKGWNPQHTDRLHGRLTRYLITPLLRTMEMLAGPLPALRFLSAFADPLAGEFALEASLAPQFSVPAAGGAEIGILEQVRRTLPVSAVCQSELAAGCDHFHEDLSPDQPDAGLHRLAREISAAIAGLITGGSFPWQVHVTEMWRAWAQDAARHAAAESALNGLRNDPAENARIIRTLYRALDDALETPQRPALLPSWAEVEATVPGGLEALQENALPS